MRPARRHIALDLRFGSNRVEYQPLGVVGIISPWNYPVNLSLMLVVTAIAAGNGVMLKPSKLTPATNAVLASMFSERFPKNRSPSSAATAPHSPPCRSITSSSPGAPLWDER
jgi:coniferyl-aldehyde dehydrogenase